MQMLLFGCIYSLPTMDAVACKGDWYRPLFVAMFILLLASHDHTLGSVGLTDGQLMLVTQ